jgi:outer membrane lipoprotein
MHARSLRRPARGRSILAAVALAAASGCAMPPAALRGGPFAPVSPADASSGVPASEPVRWGGAIAEVRPARDRTCLLIVDFPLDDRARPVRGDQTGGRFLACAQGFLDPEVYAPERLATVAGWLAGTSDEKVGEYAYAAPVVDAYAVHLWPKQPEVVYAWGPGPYWGWGPGAWAWAGPGWGPWGPYPYYSPWLW